MDHVNKTENVNNEWFTFSEEKVISKQNMIK